MKRTPLYMALAGLAVSGASSLTFAQDSGQVIEEVIVTGSYIPGSPEDAAVPVDVVTSEEMAKIGSPDMLEFIKNQPVSSGVLGSSNQFDGKAQGANGAGTINLRGLGPQRTLVLVNGKRVANNPDTDSVDTNLLPLAAMGRVEILKDGAAVLYGSDAVAGVVNFITKTDLDGFELGLDHQFVDGSDGNTNLKANWGWVGDNQNFLLSLGYQTKSELDNSERDWALKSFEENPRGGWSGGGSPGGFITDINGGLVGPSATNPLGIVPLIDGGCNDFVANASQITSGVPRCRFQYTALDNLVDPLDRYQAHAEYNLTFGPDIDFHIEGTYSKTETEFNTSPSYLATQSPTASSFFGMFYIPKNDATYGTHPAFAAWEAAYPSVAPFTTNGVTQAVLTFRPYGWGGNPLQGNDATVDDRSYEQFRFATGFSGLIGDSIGWDVSLSYSEVEGHRIGHDTVVNHYQAALVGLGGPNCNTLTPGTNGCYYFNPFSTAIAANSITGVANPNVDNANLNNNAELLDWMFAERWDTTTNTNLTFDAVFNGDLGVELSGGMIQWAAGIQYRDNEYERSVSANQNLDINPCAAAAETQYTLNEAGAFTTCAAAGEAVDTGIFFFLGGSRNSTLDSDVSAVFAEFMLPLTDTLEATIALRHEAYGGETGSTTDPKVALRWQATDWMAFRTSYSSTFRAPTQVSLQDASGTSLQNINSTFRAIDTFGDPELQPEKADAYNLGVIWTHGGLNASLDYWLFDMTEALTTDPLGGMVAAMFGDPASALDDNCGNALYAGLESRFTFSGTCGIDNISRVRTNNVNGSDREISGIDWALSYDWDLANGDVITAGTAGSYTLGYDFEDVYVEGILVEEGRDAVGALNAQTSAYPLPEVKGNIYAQYAMGDANNFRLTARMIDEYVDIRPSSITANGGKQPKIDSWVTYDFTYRYIMSTDLAETVFNVTIENLTDEDPPFVELDLNYDPFTHSALGRTIKLGVTANF